MSEPKAALYTITGQGADPPSLAEAAAQLRISEADLDPAFGVVPIDPAQRLYAVQTRDGAPAAVPEAGPDESYSGPFSNPRIAPFGPPEPDES